MAKSILESVGSEVSQKPTMTVRSLWGPVRLMAAFFTFDSEDVRTHYSKDRKGQYLCLGENCPACAAAGRFTAYTLLPYWNLVTRSIEILKLQRSADGPKDRVKAFLLRYAADLSNVIGDISGSEDGKISIKALAARPDTDRGFDQCLDFGTRLARSEFKLQDVFLNLTADEIRKLPDVRGLVLEEFDNRTTNLDLDEFDPSDAPEPVVET